MDKEQAIELAKKYADIIKSYFNIKKVVLYGSYACGKQTSDSDIDVAVIVDKIDGNILDVEAKLYKLRRNLDLRIEPILLDEKEDISGFKDEVLKTGIIVYHND
ncbi:nucleotidyltransferase domain protein [bacterium BMS3Abin03]|nr:nucleotidyltransferase domain protein [bacterium BMS3Abin03]